MRHLSKKNLISGLLILLFLFQGLIAQSTNTWKGITPYITTRAVVEKILGNPGEYGLYELEEGRVSVAYHEKACALKDNCLCLIPLDTVINVSITLYYDLSIKKLKLNPKLFKKEAVSGDPRHLGYYNLKDGIVYEVVDGRVKAIHYYESEKTCEEIRKKYQTTEQ